MNRQAALAILQGLDSESLIRALAANGIQLGQPQQQAMIDELEAQPLPTWSEIKTGLTGNTGRPTLFSKNAAIDPPAQEPTPLAGSFLDGADNGGDDGMGGFC